MSQGAQRALVLLLAVVGLLLIAAAVLYFALPAKSLPSFMGHISHATVHRNKRGVAALVVGLGVLALAWLQARAASRPGT